MHDVCLWLQVITADGATIEIGADVYFRVYDAVLSVTNIQDLNYSTRIICQTSLQKHIAKKNLGDIENDRQTITNSLQVFTVLNIYVNFWETLKTTDRPSLIHSRYSQYSTFM